jgi:hypothetical protein
LKIREVLVGFEEGLLHHVFGVLAASSDVHPKPEDFAFVSVDEGLKRRDVPASRRGY